MGSDGEQINRHSNVNFFLALVPVVFGVLEDVIFYGVEMNNPLYWMPWSLIIFLIVWLMIRKNHPSFRPAFRSLMNFHFSWYVYITLIMVPFLMVAGYDPTDAELDILLDRISESWTSIAALAFWLFLSAGAFLLYAILSIVFALKIRKDVNAKPPLAIRFLK